MKHTKFRFTNKFHWECDKCNFKMGAVSKKELNEMIEDHKKSHKRRPLGWAKK